MDLKIGDIQETALITLAIRASETDRPNARIKDLKAKEIIDTLGVDVSKYDPFMSHEGVVALSIFSTTWWHIKAEYTASARF
ncbi:MAG: hypothetical protein J6X62_02840 [Bacteroidales bacterium]|nr:hypothetical protein [Bacteroidales bacterium]